MANEKEKLTIVNELKKITKELHKNDILLKEKLNPF
jgi:hypothetical protein